MDFRKVHVLLLEGYARQILPMAKAFRQLGCEVTTLNASKLDVGYVSRYPNHKIIDCCSREDYARTVSVVRRLLKTGKYDLVVPMVDYSAALLSKNKEEFSQYAKVASNDWDLYDIAQDKLKTMKACMENNIPCPVTLTSMSSIDDIRKSNLEYPLVVKPRVSYGAIGFKVIYSEEQLSKFFETCVNTDDYLLQEYIPQTDMQFNTIMFLDEKSEVKSAVVFTKNRWFPISGGSSTLNITVDRPDIVDICTNLLKAIGWKGCADIDLIQDPRDGIVKVIEINPRISANIKICFESGINIAKQILEKEFGKPVTQYSKYRVGQRMRYSQSDLLWFIKSSNRFTTKPSWFSFKTQKTIYFQSVTLCLGLHIRFKDYSGIGRK